MATHIDTRSGKKHAVQRRNKEKENLQHQCKGELTGKEETSERNSTPSPCSNEARIINVCVIKVTTRALLCLETSAASGACNIIGNIRQTLLIQGGIAEDPICPFSESQWRKRIQQNTRDFSY